MEQQPDVMQGLEDIPMTELVSMMAAVQRMGTPDEKLPDDDKEYSLFSEGEHVDKTFRRVKNPSVRLQESVSALSMKCMAVAEFRKIQLAEHFGWDINDKTSPHYPTKELGGVQLMEQVLPMIVRGGMPQSWDVKDISTKIAKEMYDDFLLST